MPKHSKSFEPYGSTIFCEDIRQETNGMATIVGAFLSNVGVPELPIVMPKFGIFTTVILPRENKNVFDINLRVFLPGDGDVPTVDIENTVKSERPSEDESQRDPDIPPHIKLTQHLILSPFEIKEAGFVKVRLNVNGSYIKAGVIRIGIGSPTS